MANFPLLWSSLVVQLNNNETETEILNKFDKYPKFRLLWTQCFVIINVKCVTMLQRIAKRINHESCNMFSNVSVLGSLYKISKKEDKNRNIVGIDQFVDLHNGINNIPGTNNCNAIYYNHNTQYVRRCTDFMERVSAEILQIIMFEFERTNDGMNYWKLNMTFKILRETQVKIGKNQNELLKIERVTNILNDG